MLDSPPAGFFESMRTSCCGFAQRQRPQQEGIDHAEDGYVGANPKPEDQHCDDGESAVAAQSAEGEAQVLQQHIQPR